MPGISFIIPTYNAERHIELCLKSIRGQSYPQDKVEILILDGLSVDRTLDIANKYNCRILHNKKRLAEYGVQLGVKEARGEFLVIFAADNELVGDSWIENVLNVFTADPLVCAVWGRLCSGEGDSAINKYFELIQSDPLNWFLNNNLRKYIRQGRVYREGIVKFEVSPQSPLVWGANGLTYRMDKIRRIWSQENYLGDNDAFQYMIENGDAKVAYFTGAFVYHHHVARLADWIKKWRRNLVAHLLDKRASRNMNWVFTADFKRKLLFWVFYAAFPVFSSLHAAYLAAKERKLYWFYHPLVTLAQFFTYTTIIIFTRKGRSFIRGIIFP